MAKSNKKACSFVEDSVKSKYSIGEELGRGAYGVVRSGTDHVTSEKVALKLSASNSRFSEFMNKEIFIYKELEGLAGIPRLISYGRDFLAIEKLGDSLHNILLKSRYVPLALRSTLLIADQLISRLEAIHSRDIFHQDLKTSNVLIGLGSNSNVVYIIDFGSAIYGPSKTFEHNWQKQDLIQAGYIILDLFQGSLTFRRFTERPSEVEIYLKYCKKLKLGDKIDYNYLKQIFRENFESNGFRGTVIFEEIYLNPT